MALLGGAVIAIMLPLVQEQQWKGSGKWLRCSWSACCCWRRSPLWERRIAAARPDPGGRPRLFRNRSYTLGAALALLYFAGFTTIFFIFTLYLQNGLNYSALEAGLAITPFALGSAVAPPSAAAGRQPAGPGDRVGLVLVAVGTGAAILAVHWVPVAAQGWPRSLPLLIAGVGPAWSSRPTWHCRCPRCRSPARARPAA